MDQSKLRAPSRRAFLSCLLAGLVLAPGTASARERNSAAMPAATTAALLPAGSRPVSPDSLFGRSGKLRFRLFSSSRLFGLPILERLFGNPEGEVRPGIYQAAEEIMGRPFAFISLIPFAAKDGGTMGDYRVGFWPSERRRNRSDRYH